MTAILGPGLRGPEAEAALAEHGVTLGHFPQSFEHASIGGFAATRSSGQASAGYGRFDALVVGLTVVTPTGTMTLGSAPASAAGPDLRQLVLGSEGAFGVITSVTVRVRPVPEEKVYEGWRWPTFAEGVAAVRAIAQSGIQPTVLRLSDESESAVNLADPDAIGGSSGGGVGGCLMVVGFEGAAARVAERRAGVTELLTGLGGAPGGEEPGRAWEHGRFRAPYLRDSLLDLGVLVETLETATFWSGVEDLYAGVKAALEAELAVTTRRLSCSATSRTSTRPVAPSTSRWPPAGRRAPGAVGAGQAGRQRRDRRPGRDHHPPPRHRHRPPALAGGGDRPGRRPDPASGQGRARSDRRAQPGVLIPQAGGILRTGHP